MILERPFTVSVSLIFKIFPDCLTMVDCKSFLLANVIIKLPNQIRFVWSWLWRQNWGIRVSTEMRDPKKEGGYFEKRDQSPLRIMTLFFQLSKKYIGSGISCTSLCNHDRSARTVQYRYSCYSPLMVIHSVVQ